GYRPVRYAWKAAHATYWRLRLRRVAWSPCRRTQKLVRPKRKFPQRDAMTSCPSTSKRAGASVPLPRPKLPMPCWMRYLTKLPDAASLLSLSLLPVFVLALQPALHSVAGDAAADTNRYSLDSGNRQGRQEPETTSRYEEWGLSSLACAAGVA